MEQPFKPFDDEIMTIIETHAKNGFLDIDKLSHAARGYIDKLNEQLAVYTTIGCGTSESPMWFIFDKVTDANNNYEPFSFVARDTTKDKELKLCLKFRSSQNGYMFFNVPVDILTAAICSGDNKPVLDFFRAIKYAHIKKHWITVYKEIRGF